MFVENIERVKDEVNRLSGAEVISWYMQFSEFP